MKVLVGISILFFMLFMARMATAAPSAHNAGASLKSPKPMLLAAYKKKKVYRRSSRKTPRYKGKVFVFSPRNLRWYAYQNGRLIKSGRASGGASYCRDVKRACRTPRGTFYITRKGGPGCRSSRYPRPHGGAWMGYCMFFSKYYAVHASNNVPRYNASHGCIRVTPSAARWLHRNFLHYGTRVVVTSY